MYWINDNATVLYVLLGFLAAIAFFLWWKNRKNEYLYPVGVLLVVLLLVWLCTFLVVSDRQQIRNALDNIEHGIETKNPHLVVENLSKDFAFRASNGPVTKKDVEDYLSGAMEWYGNVSLRFTQFEYNEIDRREKIAKVTFRMVATSDRSQQPFPALCRSEFAFENGKWVLKKIAFFKPVANTDQTILIPFPRGGR